MQPQDPITGPASQPPAARDPAPVSGAPQAVGPPHHHRAFRKPPNRRARLVLAMVAGVIGLLCLGGVGVAVSLYNEATEIKRTAPDAVVDNFIRAYLVSRDQKEVELFACKTSADFTQLEAYRQDIENRESRFSISILVTWEGLRVSTNGNQGTVDVDLTRAIQDGSEQITNSWRFAIVDQDGWRVCGATKLS